MREVNETQKAKLITKVNSTSVSNEELTILKMEFARTSVMKCHLQVSYGRYLSQLSKDCK